MSVVNRFRLSGTSTMPALFARAGRPVLSGVPSTATVPDVRGQEPGEREQERGLARAVGTEKRLDGPAVESEVDVTERSGRRRSHR